MRTYINIDVPGDNWGENRKNAGVGNRGVLKYKRAGGGGAEWS
jgi:hypothetical protein